MSFAADAAGFDSHFGFQHSALADFPYVSFEEMQAICQNINMTKSYEFNPVVILEQMLFDQLEQVLNGTLPLNSNGRRTFIISGLLITQQHWYVIEVFKQDATIKILVIGKQICNLLFYLRDVDFERLQNLSPFLEWYNIQPIITEEFGLDTEEDDPRIPIQTDFRNCAFFALYAAKHLHNVEESIPGKMSLFEYLQVKSFERHTFYKPKQLIVETHLPLVLALPAQTRRLWTSYLPTHYSEEERCLAMNKKGFCAEDIIAEHKVFSETAQKEQNHLIECFRNKELRQYYPHFSDVLKNQTLSFEYKMEVFLENFKDESAGFGVNLMNPRRCNIATEYLNTIFTSGFYRELLLHKDNPVNVTLHGFFEVHGEHLLIPLCWEVVGWVGLVYRPGRWNHQKCSSDAAQEMCEMACAELQKAPHERLDPNIYLKSVLPRLTQDTKLRRDIDRVLAPKPVVESGWAIPATGGWGEFKADA